MLGVTKKVPLSGEVRLGSFGTERPGSAISYHNHINCLSPELQLSFQRQFHWLRLGSGVG